MDNNCCNKKTKRSPEEKKLIINRLNRISGQINGINKMIENDAYCNDVLIQLSAVKNSIKSLSTHILENHLYMCVARDLENGDLDSIDELISLFKRFNQEEVKIMDKIVICEKCGAMVKVLIDCKCENCGIKCCGETMKEISAEEANKYLEKK
ncbi:MAG: metal-sensing transcriptional repressor [Clostridia bacterium]|nr:metal-sensing transcriptional repressor [Clostridia bacterium]